MIPAGVEIIDVQSVWMSDDGASLSFYLEMSDGSTAAVNVPFAYMCERADIIEGPTHAPRGMVLN